MVDDEDVFVLSGSDIPGSAEELDGAGGTDAAGNMQSQMQVEKFGVWCSSQLGAFFNQGFVPGLIGGQAGGAVLVRSVVVSDFSSQELVGLLIGLDFFVSKERDQPALQGAKEPFNFAFGLWGRSDAVVDGQGRQSALELTGGILAIGGGAVAEET